MNEIFPKEFDTSYKRTDASPPKSRALLWLAVIVVLMSGLIALGAWYAIHQYNELQRKDEIVDAEWSQVLNQYTRRADLIPNLVSVVKSYATHESKLFGEIAAARSNLIALSKSVTNSRDPQVLDQFQKAQNQLSAPLSRLLLIAESYPALKASELFRDLMVQLEGTENRISYSRQRYIGAVADYNLAIRTFPTNLIASQAGNKPRPRFAVENESAVTRVPAIDLK